MADEDRVQPDAWGLYHTRVHKSAGRARAAQVPKRRDPDLSRSLETLRGLDGDEARAGLNPGKATEQHPGDCKGCQELRLRVAALERRLSIRPSNGYPESTLLASRGRR